MDTATLPAETEAEQGAPVEQGAEATRSAANLFQYSSHVHAGAGAKECEHGEDGACKDPAHFHAWVCLPNSLQHEDILEKARAAMARRKRALKDAGSPTRPASDAYVILESELDDLMAQERPPLLQELAERVARRGAVERIRLLIEEDERFKEYWQDAEEWHRLKDMPEEDRPTEEFESLDQEMTEFEEALDKQRDDVIAQEVSRLEVLDEEALRAEAREVRIDGEAVTANRRTYYLWMGFICTKVPLLSGASRRTFEKLEDFRNASPEIVDVIDEALRDLESRHTRGEAAGN